MSKDWLESLSELNAQKQPSVVITLIRSEGSVPQELGAKAIVTENGLHFGTIGGGRVEAKAIEFAIDLLRQLAQSSDKDFARTKILEWNLVKDVGMTCGGTITFLFEVFALPAWKIVVFGAGHVAQELVPLLCRLDCQITCVDERADWLERLRDHRKLNKIHSSSPAELVPQFPENTFFVLMTQGHRTDLPILYKILQGRLPPYVGVIGSASKALVLRKDLAKLGIPPALAESFHCPMGLPIGNSTPAEIAISITAQLIGIRDRKEKPNPIA